MAGRRIHILGASGSGTTTLGRHLADQIDAMHLDTDEFYWDKSANPFTMKVPIVDRIRMIEEQTRNAEFWVLSGSLCSWGDSFIEQFTDVVFLWVPWEIREQRLRDRERVRFGQVAISPGGEMHQNHTEFIHWASRYDAAGLEQRSLQTHEQWLRLLPDRIRVAQLKECYPIHDLTELVKELLDL